MARQESERLNPALTHDMAYVTQSAALAVSRLVGHGNEKAADAAAVKAMRDAFNELSINGTVVIGEGERDQAPMLYIGEEVGRMGADDISIDIALDPLEGTTLAANGSANAIAVLAIAPKGSLLNAPDVYMEKVAIGPGYEAGLVSVEKTPIENIQALAKAKGVEPKDIRVCILERQRHQKIISELHGIGCSTILIEDGDIAGVIATARESSNVDIYMGIGGAPEGVLAAAALNCIGGQFEGRLLFRNDDERDRAHRCGIEDLNRVYKLHDLAKSDTIFAATGVTDGSLIRGVYKDLRGVSVTQSLIMQASTGQVSYITTEHRHIPDLATFMK
ncbi:fructose-1,6-bisphosphatase class II [Zymomonas mobilis subsp. mobilis ZM4 = ATCC 31821]|uniref:Fructose-1,6-bisphosphatase n=2 Tax=Zymomonas mobilis subsp. mobilis TaxID=120045 RepID=Q5NQ99_ZYMMO|nr:class II fructose-bisphosphatase [Zymomonas mobilis]AAV89106.1 fructose-1,6-bisphosphatase, class II [Zymomonas mobilis subsp. mobilis ZM4 = ATCC 31821]ACV75319.1 fructose-1,6-bisphosphatase, class II [Zymomonas mobilis subsp. mobilis NCIMB 11163]AEH62844.1 fructose-1,6-bisphosphatase, class II [Zymomonas mobilis subsp. mobilis ATCC 10988]ART93263.1 fructose-bisphosphatase class II [Zymomonas mobilis subsp. mobilis]AVZ25447.1 fructose-1,6-bisphosphatase class II [Zymomonas mobilis subsp. mo